MYDLVGKDNAGRAGVLGAPGSTLLGPDRSMLARGQILSGTRATVPANGTVVLTFKTQAPFRPDFVVLESVGLGQPSSVLVTNIKVGTKEQLIGETNEVPLGVFSPNNLLGRVRFDTAQTAQVVTVTLVNISAQAEVVAGAMYGERLEAE